MVQWQNVCLSTHEALGGKLSSVLSSQTKMRQGRQRKEKGKEKDWGPVRMRAIVASALSLIPETCLVGEKKWLLSLGLHTHVL